MSFERSVPASVAAKEIVEISEKRAASVSPAVPTQISHQWSSWG